MRAYSRAPTLAAVDNRDSFGLDAGAYLRHRPRYPAALYDYLASLAPAREAALDCATGNGQAAVGLAAWFRRVAAFDSSSAQIAVALSAPNVEYRVGVAEKLPFPDWKFDLITAAQAAHWFDLPTFYAEIAKVARPGAVLAIWGYSYCRVEPAIDRIVESTLLEPIEPYWADGNKVIVERYRRIEFPFEERPWPGFVSPCNWSRDDYAAYLRTLSAVRKFALEQGRDPVANLVAALDGLWPASDVKRVEFDLVGRVGRVDRGARTKTL